MLTLFETYKIADRLRLPFTSSMESQPCGVVPSKCLQPFTLQEPKFEKGVQGSIFARNFLAGIGFPHGRPVVTYEDNQATEAAVLTDRTMP
jgi:hypothetical protein